MQRIFLSFIVICCSVDFATILASESLAKSDKKTSVMMKTFVKISAESLPEVPTTLKNDDETFDNSFDADKNSEIPPLEMLDERLVEKNEIVVQISSEEKLEVLTTDKQQLLSTAATVVAPTKRQIKLNAKQNLILNQIIGAYALSGINDPLCKNHTQEYKRALREFEPWALKMFDSSSKLQAGIFMGNLMEYGSFRQCIEIYTESDFGPIRGQHCTLKITPNDQLLQYFMSYKNVSRKRFEKARKLMLGAALSWSVCVPDSCSSKDVLQHFNKTILSVTEGLALNVSIGEYDCYTIKDEVPLSQTEWMVITGFFVLFLITAICTVIDIKTKSSDASNHQFLKIFSAVSNVKKLLAVRTEKQPLDCLNGIRFLSMCYVVMGHTYVMSMFFPLINALDIMDWVLYYTSTTIIGGTICVDTFFMITGLLVTYSVFDQMSKGTKFNLPLFYLHRYLRVTPTLMVVALVHATLIQHLGSGPLWKKTVRSVQKPCQYFWWAAMLHIQNYVNAPYICVLPTWYLTCDTQYYFISPLIVYPLWKWPVFGWIILIFSYILSVAISFYVAWINEYDAMGLLSNQFLRSEYFKYHYIAPHTRASPFIIGIGLGYLLFKTRNMKLHMNPFVVLMGWICSFVLLLVPVLGTRPFQLEDHDYNRMEHSLFLSCSRSAWTLGVAWIIWACRHGYGGPVDYVLSFPTYQILARISYSVFLTHMGSQFMMHGASKAPGYFSDFSLIYKFFGDILIALPLAFCFTLFIESPIIKAEGLLMKKVSRKIDKIEPIEKIRVVTGKENGRTVA